MLIPHALHECEVYPLLLISFWLRTFLVAECIMKCYVRMYNEMSYVNKVRYKIKHAEKMIYRSKKLLMHNNGKIFFSLFFVPCKLIKKPYMHCQKDEDTIIKV